MYSYFSLPSGCHCFFFLTLLKKLLLWLMQTWSKCTNRREQGILACIRSKPRAPKYSFSHVTSRATSNDRSRALNKDTYSSRNLWLCKSTVKIAKSGKLLPQSPSTYMAQTSASKDKHSGNGVMCSRLHL